MNCNNISDLIPDDNLDSNPLGWFKCHLGHVRLVALKEHVYLISKSGDLQPVRMNHMGGRTFKSSINHNLTVSVDKRGFIESVNT